MIDSLLWFIGLSRCWYYKNGWQRRRLGFRSGVRGEMVRCWIQEAKNPDTGKWCDTDHFIVISKHGIQRDYERFREDGWHRSWLSYRMSKSKVLT